MQHFIETKPSKVSKTNNPAEKGAKNMKRQFREYRNIDSKHQKLLNSEDKQMKA